jgi:hypothetical protein
MLAGNPWDHLVPVLSPTSARPRLWGKLPLSHLCSAHRTCLKTILGRPCPGGSHCPLQLSILPGQPPISIHNQTIFQPGTKETWRRTIFHHSRKHGGWTRLWLEDLTEFPRQGDQVCRGMVSKPSLAPRTGFPGRLTSGMLLKQRGLRQLRLGLQQILARILRLRAAGICLQRPQLSPAKAMTVWQARGGGKPHDQEEAGAGGQSRRLKGWQSSPSSEPTLRKRILKAVAALARVGSTQKGRVGRSLAAEL